MAAKPKPRPILEHLQTVIFAIFFGIISLTAFLVDVVRKGPKRMFHVKERKIRPAALDSDEFGTHEFIRLKSSRVTLHYVASGSKTKPLMLFLHGFPEFWYSWRFQLKEFSKDYRVVAIDMRGYGDSDKPSCVSDYYIEHLTDDVRDVISGLGYESCVLVAHDWGGIVAFMFTILHPRMVERLIVCNTAHPAASEDHRRSSRSQLFKSWYMYVFQIPVFPLLLLRADDLSALDGFFCGSKIGAKSGAFTAEDIEAYKYTYADNNDFLGPISYYRARWRYAFPNFRGENIKAPTLMIWGTNDGALEEKMADLSRHYIDDFTLKRIEGASHWVQQEEPERVNAYMREFLSKKS